MNKNKKYQHRPVMIWPVFGVAVALSIAKISENYSSHNTNQTPILTQDNKYTGLEDALNKSLKHPSYGEARKILFNYDAPTLNPNQFAYFTVRENGSLGLRARVSESDQSYEGPHGVRIELEEWYARQVMCALTPESESTLEDEIKSGKVPVGGY